MRLLCRCPISSFWNETRSEDDTGQTEARGGQEDCWQPPGGGQGLEQLGGQAAGGPVGQGHQARHAALGAGQGGQEGGTPSPAAQG